MRDRNLDLVVAVVVAALAAVAASLPLPGTVLLVFGLGMLAAAGYVLGEAVLGPDARTVEGLALTVVLVLGLPAVGGVVFHAEGIPLQRGAWVTLFVVFTALGAAIAGRRRQTAPRPEPDAENAAAYQAAYTAAYEGARRGYYVGTPAVYEAVEAPVASRRGPSPRVLLGAAGVVLATAVWLAVSGANAQRYPAFTELSLVAHSDQAVVGVRNVEDHRQRYLVVLRRNDGVPIRYRIDLQPGATWTQTIPRPNGAGLNADLFTGPESDKPFRRVFLARTQDVALR